MQGKQSGLTLPLSALTTNGVAEFKKLIASAPSLSVKEVEKGILEIAGGSKSAEVVKKSVTVPVFPQLDTRHNTAELVASVLSKAKIDAGPSTGHELMFSWLALMFLPSLCKRNNQGSLETGKMYRYVLTRSTSDFYRHLVACPYWLLHRYGESARIFLCQKAHIMPDVVEQVVSRPTLINSDGVIELIDRLYWDKSAGAPRDGFTSTERIENPPPGYAKTSPDPGTLRALEWTLGQLQCTYDLRSMSADQIMSHLPAEFSEWAASAT